MSTISINDVEIVNKNLYKHDGRYYRLFAKDITPNRCWLIAPVMKELLDIDVATGLDVYSSEILEFNGVTGTVSASHEFITY